MDTTDNRPMDLRSDMGSTPLAVTRRAPLVPAIPPSEDPLKQLRSAALFTTISGALYAVLFITSFWLMLDVPRPSASDGEIDAFYSSGDSTVVSAVSLYLLPFAGIAFLWFIVTVRMWISLRSIRPIDELFSNVQLLSGVIFLALLFSSAAALSIGAVASDVAGTEVDPLIAREFPLFGGSLFFVFATRMGAMFVFTTTRICASAAIVPRWFALIGVIVGVVMLLTSSFNRGMIVVFPLWVLLLCVLIQLHVRHLVDRRRAMASSDPAVSTESEA
ncbi:MAG: hypothetical protein ACTHMX_07725 [Thermomicrobiales bacterium]